MGKGSAKERLIESELEIRSVLRSPVPNKLIPLKDQIKQKLLYAGNSVDNKQGSVARSLYGKRNSTASKIIAEIIALHREVEAHIKYSEVN